MNRNTVLCKAIENEIVIPASEQLKAVREEEIEFSDNYRQKTSCLIREVSRNCRPMVKFALKRLILVAAAMLLLGSFNVQATPWVSEKLTEITFTPKLGYAEICADCPEFQNSDNFSEQLYKPSYVTEGFEATEQDISERYITIDYYNDKQFFNYVQSGWGFSLYINTEDQQIEHCTFDECDAYFVYDEESTTLVWCDGMYVFCITGDLTKSEAIKTASSLEPVN